MGGSHQSKDLPIVARSHQISRQSEAILDLILNPWPINFFPNQNDYGIDGDVKLTADGDLAPRIRPYTFQFQLKGTEMKKDEKPSVCIETRHLMLWLCHNVPIVLFLVVVNKENENVYWRCMDTFFLQWLKLDSPNWRGQTTKTIVFSESDLFLNKDRRVIESTIENWRRPLDPDDEEV